MPLERKNRSCRHRNGAFGKPGNQPVHQNSDTPASAYCEKSRRADVQVAYARCARSASPKSPHVLPARLGRCLIVRGIVLSPNLLLSPQQLVKSPIRRIDMAGIRNVYELLAYGVAPDAVGGWRNGADEEGKIEALPLSEKNGE